MSRQLGDLDGRAIDLLLDRADAEPIDGKKLIGSDHVPPERIQSAEKILSLLQHVPAADPPSDLVSRTLQRIEAIAAAPKPPASIDPRPSIDADHNHRPVA
jgi:hypothetical protein